MENILSYQVAVFTEALPTMPLLKTDLLRTRLNLKNGKQKQTNNNKKNDLRCKKVNRKYNTYKKIWRNSKDKAAWNLLWIDFQQKNTYF